MVFVALNVLKGILLVIAACLILLVLIDMWDEWVNSNKPPKDY